MSLPYLTYYLNDTFEKFILLHTCILVSILMPQSHSKLPFAASNLGLCLLTHVYPMLRINSVIKPEMCQYDTDAPAQGYPHPHAGILQNKMRLNKGP